VEDHDLAALGYRVVDDLFERPIFRLADPAATVRQGSARRSSAGPGLRPLDLDIPAPSPRDGAVGLQRAIP